MIFSLYPDEKKRLFEILGTNYNLVKEGVFYSNAAVISPRANGTRVQIRTTFFHSWKSIVLEVCKHGNENLSPRNYQSSQQSEIISRYFCCFYISDFCRGHKNHTRTGRIGFRFLHFTLRQISILVVLY